MRHINRLYIFMVLLSIVLFLSACQPPAESTDNASTPADASKGEAEVAIDASTATPWPTIPPTAVVPTPDISAYSQMDLSGNRWGGSRYCFYPCPLISG